MLKKYNGHLDDVKLYRKFVFLDLKESDETPITAKDLIDLGDALDLSGEQDFRMTAANIPAGQNYALEGENSSDLQRELLDFSETSGSEYEETWQESTALMKHTPEFLEYKFKTKWAWRTFGLGGENKAVLMDKIQIKLNNRDCCHEGQDFLIRLYGSKFFIKFKRL